MTGFFLRDRFCVEKVFVWEHFVENNSFCDNTFSYVLLYLKKIVMETFC